MKQRKKQPVITRQAILAAAGSLFSVHGYAGTGIGAIVAETGLTKGALFHHFPDKRTLACEWVRDDLAVQIQDQWIQPMEAVASLAEFLSFCRDRCLGLLPDDVLAAMTALTAEVSSNDEVLRDALAVVADEWQGGIADLLKRGQGDGWIHPSIQPATEAAVIASMFAGISVISKGKPADFLRSSSQAIEGYLETLRPQSN